MNEYPNINPGDGFGKVSARQWRNLVEQVATLNRTIFGESDTQRTPSGMRTTPRGSMLSMPADDKTVVIVKAPADGDKTLTVREARYVNLPPKPCEGDGETATCYYEWFAGNFLAYPPLGTKASEFAGDEFTEAETSSPKLTTKFHRIHREHDAWILEARAAEGGSTTDICLVHAPMNGGTNWSGANNFIRVVHVKKKVVGTTISYVSDESTTPLPNGSPAPGYSLVQCWPGTKESFWQFLQSTTGTQPNFGPTTTAVYMTTKKIRGVEYIAPEVAIAMFLPDTTYAAGDCLA